MMFWAFARAGVHADELFKLISATTDPVELRRFVALLELSLAVGGLAVLALLSVQDWEKHHPHEGPGDGPPAKQGVRITVGDLAIEQ